MKGGDPGWAQGPEEQGAQEIGRQSLLALPAEVGAPGTPSSIPLWVQLVGASACLGLQNKKGRSSVLGFQTPGSHPGRLSGAGWQQWEGTRVSERMGATVPEPHNHERAGHTVHTATRHHTRLTVLQMHVASIPGTHHYSLSHTNSAQSWPPTVMHRHAPSLRALTQPGTCCHAQAHSPRRAPSHARHTHGHFQSSTPWPGKR